MNVYVYQAALLCEDCGLATQQAIQLDVGADWKNTIRVDSDQYPQGPYAEGGGEADSPQHCDHCGLFLENQLTTDGLDYVRDQAGHLFEPDNIAQKVWAPFYGVTVKG